MKSEESFYGESRDSVVEEGVSGVVDWGEFGGEILVILVKVGSCASVESSSCASSILRTHGSWRVMTKKKPR